MTLAPGTQRRESVLGNTSDPDAAKRVENYYIEGKPFPEFYSFKQLVGAVRKRPFAAVAYRLARSPILWLGSQYPFSLARFDLIQAWCLGIYFSLAAFCIVQSRNRRQIPEVLYLFVLLLLCASPLIHSEFRYSFPVWNTLVLTPGLLLATLSRNGWRRQWDDPRFDDLTKPSSFDARSTARRRLAAPEDSCAGSSRHGTCCSRKTSHDLGNRIDGAKWTVHASRCERSTARGGRSRSRFRRFIRRLQRIGGKLLRPTVLLVALLIVHLCSRLWLHRTSPLSGVHNFDRVYAVSLSLMAGRGFNDLAVDASPASAPLREFFELRRTHISREEFATYLASEPDSTRDSKYQWYLPLATTRVADVRLAAILWRIFGIDRHVLATFYSLFSLATCAALFFIARRLTGSGWAGLAASALLTLSPIEGFLNTWSWRDASPMWFTALALAWFVCGFERFRRPAMNLGSYLVLGALTCSGDWMADRRLDAGAVSGRRHPRPSDRRHASVGGICWRR